MNLESTHVSLSLFFTVTVTSCASKRWSWPEMTRAEAGWHRKEGVSVGWVSVRWCLQSWPGAATSSSMASASKTSRCGTNTHNPQPQHGSQTDLQHEQFCMLRSFPGKTRLWFADLCQWCCGLCLWNVPFFLAGRWSWSVSWGMISSIQRPRPHFTTGRSTIKNVA